MLRKAILFGAAMAAAAPAVVPKKPNKSAHPRLENHR